MEQDQRRTYSYRSEEKISCLVGSFSLSNREGGGRKSSNLGSGGPEARGTLGAKARAGIAPKKILPHGADISSFLKARMEIKAGISIQICRQFNIASCSIILRHTHSPGGTSATRAKEWRKKKTHLHD